MKRIPQDTILRLSSYLMALFNISGEMHEISSYRLAKILGINPNQLRKDLSYFGKFGRRGVGYKVEDLIYSLKKILGLDKIWNVALCGLGNLGRALCSYKGFSEQGFLIKVIFENDPKKIGRKFNNIEVLDYKHIEGKIQKYNIQIAVLAVPVGQAQELAEKIYNSGIRFILNFVPLNINLPSDCLIRNVYMSSELTCLSYFLARR
ncbi:MAG: redox-sensing transcriptional repressor Rex [Candidatus Omnitrophica bacterium]|nr:redox-sensing transcriptional repressor Rex [Candidatus Omnitrophota bacterium]